MQAPRIHWLAWLVVATCACLPVASAAQPAATPHPSLRCQGASTMASLVASWMRAAHRKDPASRYRLLRGSRFSAQGVQSALRGRINCVSFAREPFPREAKAYRERFGSPPILIPVAQGSYRTPHGTFALAVYVNRSNPLKRLSMRQLRRVLGRPSGQGDSVHTWGELGAKGAWRNRPVHVYGMRTLRASGNPPGIVNFLEQRVLRGWQWRHDLRELDDKPGISALEGIVRAVASDPDAIGYSGIGYARPAVAMLALSHRADQVYFPPSVDNVAKARYPLSRRIYLGFTPRLDARMRHMACRLVAVALGPEGRKLDALDAMHFLPLSEAQALSSARLARRELGCSLPRNHTSAVTVARHGQAEAGVSIIGYNDMAGMFRSWNRQFARIAPDVAIHVSLPGTRYAPAALADGRSQMAPMGAPLSASQLRHYRAIRHADPVGFKVAHASNDPRARSSPIAIYVHRSNPLHALTLDQLRQVFGRGKAGQRPTWGVLGLGGAWATRPIDVCGLAPSTALGQYMLGRLHLKDGFTAGYLAFSESSGAVRQAVKDRSALCFGDLNDASGTARRVALAARAGGSIHTGTREDIHAGTYPLDRFLYIYVRKQAGTSVHGSLVCRYLAMVLSNRGQAMLEAAPPGYIALDVAERRQQRKRLARIGCQPGDSGNP